MPEAVPLIVDAAAPNAPSRISVPVVPARLPVPVAIAISKWYGNVNAAFGSSCTAPVSVPVTEPPAVVSVNVPPGSTGSGSVAGGTVWQNEYVSVLAPKGAMVPWALPLTASCCAVQLPVSVPSR